MRRAGVKCLGCSSDAGGRKGSRMGGAGAEARSRATRWTTTPGRVVEPNGRERRGPGARRGTARAVPETADSPPVPRQRPPL